MQNIDIYHTTESNCFGLVNKILSPSESPERYSKAVNLANLEEIKVSQINEELENGIVIYVFGDTLSDGFDQDHSGVIISPIEDLDDYWVLERKGTNIPSGIEKLSVVKDQYSDSELKYYFKALPAKFDSPLNPNIPAGLSLQLQNEIFHV